MPGVSKEYWNPFLETLPREKLIDIELKNFRKYLQYAKENCAFYRHRYKDIDPEDIRSLEDVRKLPLIDKQDLRLAQEGKGDGLFGEILGVQQDDVTDNHWRCSIEEGLILQLFIRYKFEYRSTKLETISNDKNSNDQNFIRAVIA